MTRFLVAAMLLLLAPVAIAGHNGDRNTQTTVQCLPNPAAAYQAVTCTAFVQDMYGVAGQRSPPTGTVNFSVTTGPGSVSPASCNLAATGAQGQSSCSVTYTPTAGGSHTISAGYGGAAATDFIGNWLSSSGSTNVTINNPVPAITSISPANGVIGQTLDITINGSNFVSAGVIASFGANVTVNSVTWINSTTLVANISIASTAATGPRDVTVTNPLPSGGSATLVNGFEVRNPLPAITGLTPAAVEEGSGAVVVTIDGSGFVSNSVAYFNGSPRTTTFVNSNQLQMDLVAGDTATVGDYNVYVINSAPGGGTSNTATFSVVMSGGSFDTVEPGAILGTNMFTKRAGVGFSFDILATEVSRLAVNTAFTGTVKIELLDATDGSGVLGGDGCRPSWTVVQTLPNQAFTAGNNGRISASTNYSNALRAARFRISYPATGIASHVGCSADAFSIRPDALSLTTTLTNTATTGTPIHAAGATFAMTAATGIAGYDGTPQIDTAQLAEHAGAITPGTLGGSFPAASSVTGSSEGTSFTYSEVGHFTLPAASVYDTAFTAVDQPGDCTAGFSNVASVEGKYGCSFGTTADVSVGRFVPAYFDVTVADACTDATGFTYSGQPFTVTVTARNAAGARTDNYDNGASFSKIVTLSNAGDTSGFDGVTNLIAAADFSSGTYTVNDIEYTFASATTPFTDIVLRAVDEDAVSSAGHTEEMTQVRSARLAIDDGAAITVNDGLLGVHLQAWQETSPGVFEWAVHADDTSCTTLAASNFDISDPLNYSDNLAPGETSISGFFFNTGEGAITLSAPGGGNDGSVLIDVTVDDWLYFDWTGAGASAPQPRMTFFEVFETEPGFIHRHEVIP